MNERVENLRKQLLGLKDRASSNTRFDNRKQFCALFKKVDAVVDAATTQQDEREFRDLMNDCESLYRELFGMEEALGEKLDVQMDDCCTSRSAKTKRAL